VELLEALLIADPADRLVNDVVLEASDADLVGAYGLMESVEEQPVVVENAGISYACGLGSGELQDNLEI